jgi:hypothetical protein
VTQTQALLQALSHAGVEFIIIGGMAAVVHGSARVTYDLDIVYARDRENIDRLVNALAPHAPYLRGAPAGLPFVWDRQTIEHGLNFTLVTSLGDIDTLGEIVGGGGYRELLPHTTDVTVFGIRCRCLNLDKLIDVKRAAGRPKDFEAIAELELIREQLEKP